MRKSILLPAIVWLFGGCPLDDPHLAPRPAVTPGDLQPDARGVSVLVRTLDPTWPQIDAMALSDNYLFFAMNWHGVYKMAKFGGPIETLDSGDGAIFPSLVTNGSDAVWEKITFDSNDNGSGQVKRQAVDGGPTLVVFGGPDPVVWKVNDATLVHVAVDGGVQLTTEPLAGGESPSTREVQDFNSGPGAFDWVVDETFVYVWEANAQQATVARYPLAGGDGLLLAQFDVPTSSPVPVGSPVDGTILLDGDDLYVRTSKDIRRIPKAGGEASIVYAAADNEIIDTSAPIGTVDDTSLFFDMSLDKSPPIASVPKAGGGPAVYLGLDLSHWNYPWQMLQSDGYLFLRSLDLSPLTPGGGPDRTGVILLVPKTPPSSL